MTATRTPGDSRMTAAILIYATLLTVLSPGAIAPVLPQIAAAFSDAADVQLLARLSLTMPALFMALTAPLAGALSQKIGKKPVLLIAVALYAVAGPAGMLARTIEELLASRAVLGVALGASMPMAIAMIGDHFHGPSRSKVLGAQASAQEIGSVVFSLAAGALGVLGWRAPFWMFCLAIPLILLVALVLREAEPHGGPKGAGGPAPGGQEERLSWADVAGAYAIGLLGMVLLFLIPIHAPFIVAGKVGPGASVWISLMMAGMTIMAALAAAAYARLKDRWSTFALFAICFGFMAAGYTVVGLAPTYPALLAGAALSGLGIGVFLPNLNFWVVGMGPAHRRGALVSGLMSSVFLGQFLCPLLTTPIAEAEGAQTLFVMAAGVAIAAALAFALIPRVSARAHAKLGR
ncbi:MAG: MFS transporter [Caulobacterales bacterium]|nr:MFS transporter [Caulobacterales bacterium]